jgi:hypothetical protein
MRLVAHPEPQITRDRLIARLDPTAVIFPRAA